MHLFSTDLAAVLDLDPLTVPVVAALRAGHELPDAFTILDTYADVGEPASWDRCDRVCREVRELMAGETIRRTFTMLDR